MHTFIRFPSCCGAALMLVTLSGLCGCGDGLARSEIRGQVTVAGMPLKAGRIIFLPSESVKGPVASAAIVNGAYMIPKREGPVAGLHRVEVEAELPLGFPLDDEAAFAQRGGAPLPPNPIPPEFNRQSNLKFDVQPGANNFNVTVPAGSTIVSGR